MSFQRKLWFAFLALGVVPMLIIGSYFINYTTTRYRDTRMAELGANARAGVHNLDIKLSELNTTLLDISSSLEINRYLQYLEMPGRELYDQGFWRRFDQSDIFLKTIYSSQNDRIKSIALLPTGEFPAIVNYDNLQVNIYGQGHHDLPLFAQTADAKGQYLWSVSPAGEGVRYPVFFPRSDAYLFVSCLVYGAYDFSPSGVAVLQLNEEYYLGYMRNILDSRDISSYVLTQDDTLVYHSGSSGALMVGKPLADSEILQLLAQHDGSDAVATVVYRGENHLLHVGVLAGNGWRVVTLTSLHNLEREAMRLVAPIILVILLVIVMAAVLSAVLSRSLYAPIRELCLSLGRVERHNLQIKLPETRTDEFGILYKSMNSFMRRIEALVQQVEEEQRLKKEADINALRAQIHPHFLYNVLNIVKCLANRRDYEGVQNTAVSLISLLRASIGDTREVIPIAREIALVSDYLLIQRFRTDYTFAFLTELEEGVEGLAIQKFILQPLVENCLVHAFAQGSARTDYCITIRGRREGDAVLLEVVDNGRAPAENERQELNERLGTANRTLRFGHIGMENVNSRIKLMFGEEYGLHMAPGPNGGSIIRVRFPAIVYDERIEMKGREQ